MENMSAEAKTFTDAWKKNFPNRGSQRELCLRL